MEEYTSNSNKSKEQSPLVQQKKIEKVVSGSVHEKKRSGVEKFTNREDVQNVKSYIISDILVPALKDFCLDALKAVLWPGGGGPRRSNKGPSERVSYRRYYDDRDDRREYRQSPIRNGFDYENYVIDNRGEAEEVLARMDEIIRQYGIVSVGDYYDLLGVDSSLTPYTLQRYGWADIRSAQVVPVRGGGYMIKLPRALPID